MCDFFGANEGVITLLLLAMSPPWKCLGLNSLFCCSVARGCEVVVKSASVLQELGITRTATQTIFRELNLERLLRRKAHLDR